MGDASTMAWRTVKRRLLASILVASLLVVVSALQATASGDMQDSIVVEDDVGDVSSINPGPGLPVGSADIVRATVYYDSGRGVIVYKFEAREGIPTEGVMILLESQLELYRPGGVTTTYTATLMVNYMAGGYSETTFVVTGHPEYGDIVYTGPDRINYSIEGNAIVLEAEVDYEATPFPALDLPYYFRASLTIATQTGATMFDEVYYESPGEGGEEPPGEAGPTTTYPANDTTSPGIVFKDLGSNTDRVSVDISSTPTYSIYSRETGIPGVSLVIVEARVVGVSSNASHVALAIEVFAGGELAGQFVVNSATYGRVDSNGVLDGYSFSLSFPIDIPGADLQALFEEYLLPEQESWSTWEYKLYLAIPSTGLTPGTPQVGPINLVEYLKREDIEVYVTAIAFENPEETLYTTKTVKAQAITGGTTETTTGTEGGEETSKETREGTQGPPTRTTQTSNQETETATTEEPSGSSERQIPGEVVVAAAIAGIAVAALAIKKILLGGALKAGI